ncbi:hypothetical protein N7540_002276 [Penicillium herquei]|nr:hypothetical protein N7540_002276 [Penicillium herquei]
MAARKYGEISEFGKTIKDWLGTTDEACPIAPCTGVVNDEQYSIDHEDDVVGKFRDDLYAGPAPDEKPEYDEDSDDSNDADYRPSGEELEELEDGVVPDNKKRVQAWYGIITKGVMIIEYMARNHDEPPISEVTNALYTDLVLEDGLKYVFIHDIQNTHTRDFISKMLFSTDNGMHGPRKAQTYRTKSSLPLSLVRGPPARRHDSTHFPLLSPSSPHATAAFTLFPLQDVGEKSFWRYDSNTEEYEGLMGTNIGRMVGYWLLAIRALSTWDCTIPTIYIALSGVNTPDKKLIDLLFRVSTTKPAHELPEKGAGPAAAPIVAPRPALKPALLGMKPAFGRVVGALPPPGGKPLETAIAAVPPIVQEIRERNQRDREE